MFRTRLRASGTALTQRLRPAVTSSSRAAAPFVNARRQLHNVPTLQHDFSEGVPNLMSPGGFAIAWTDYMTLMVEKLNALTTGKFLPRPESRHITRTWTPSLHGRLSPIPNTNCTIYSIRSLRILTIHLQEPSSKTRTPRQSPS